VQLHCSYPPNMEELQQFKGLLLLMLHVGDATKKGAMLQNLGVMSWASSVHKT